MHGHRMQSALLVYMWEAMQTAKYFYSVNQCAMMDLAEERIRTDQVSE